MRHQGPSLSRLVAVLAGLALASGCGDRAPPPVSVDPDDPASVVSGFLADLHRLEYEELEGERRSADWTTDAHREWAVAEWERRKWTDFGEPTLEPEPAGDLRVVSVVRREPKALAERDPPQARLLFHLASRDGAWRIQEVWVESADRSQRRLHPPE